MTIGIPSEIKPSESRVGMTPAGAFELTRRGHTVLVQSGAGLGSGFSDADYTDVGAELRGTIELVYAEADMIVKVKEPIESEYDLIRSGQVVFTYFHFASSASLTEAMVSSGAVCIAYETVEELDGSLPLLTPMSEKVCHRASVRIDYVKYMNSGGPLHHAHYPYPPRRHHIFWG